jgi:hypothetical protein
MAAAVDREATDHYLVRLQDGLDAALARASESQEINGGMNAQRSQVLAAAILGVNMTHRNDGAGKRAHKLIDGLRSEMSSWTRAG